MGLNELIRELEGIKEKIEKFKKELAESEALTRYALVDPVLRALGWDVFDPEKVRPEFPTEQGRPDYALLWEGKPLIMVEVKPLHANLGPAKDKGFNYCWKNKVRYFAITDGERWEVYDMEKMGGEVIATANLSENLGHAARQLLALWRPAMPELRPVPAFQSLFSQAEKKIDRPHTAEKLVGLDDLWQMIKTREIKPGIKPPQRLVFPNGEERPISHWVDILCVVTEWTSDLLRDKLPIRIGGKQKHVIIIDKTSKDMKSPRKVSDLYVDVKGSRNMKAAVRRTVFILEKAGINPNEVKVELPVQY